MLERAQSVGGDPGLCIEALAIAGQAGGSFEPLESGVHDFYVELNSLSSLSFGAGFGITLKLEADDGQVLLDWEALTNLPNGISGRGVFEAGKTYNLTLTCKGNKGGMPAVYARGPDKDGVTIMSMEAEIVDYWFVNGKSAGPTLDGAIQGYRAITGSAPMYGKWAYGFWQCKEHYQYQKDLLAAAHGYRNRSIPVDSIVQDWHYWGNLGWGPHWDLSYYPDPNPDP